MKKNLLSLLMLSTCILYSCENKNTDSAGQQKENTSSDSLSVDTTSQSFVIDTSKSIIKWVGKKVTGKHDGKIKIKSGELKTKGKTISGGSVVIDMASITNDDLTDSEMNKKLIGHLRSEDFFSVDKFPSATFEITRIDAGEKENDVIVTGNLNIKGKSSPISIPAHVDLDKDRIKASGKTTIDRTKWDIRYGSGKFFQNLGDKAIYDEVDLEFDLEGHK
jgi:polyisoprenoid-binding protein YceI